MIRNKRSARVQVCLFMASPSPYADIYVYEYIYIYVCMCVYVCVYVCTRLCMYMWVCYGHIPLTCLLICVNTTVFQDEIFLQNIIIPIIR